MSYDLTFLKSKDLNLENIYDILETEIDSSSKYFITVDERNDLSTAIESLYPNFEKYEGDDSIEYSFDSYQLTIFNSEVALTIPYWDENENGDVISKIQEVINILIGKGFTGFDGQTEEFLSEGYNLLESFSESKMIVDTAVNTSRWPWRAILGMFVLAVIVALTLFVIR